MKRFILCISLLLVFSSSQCFSSLFLMNDSPFKLKAVAVAATGMNMGEKILKPQESTYFEDTLGQSDPTGKQQTPFGNSPDSLTPYMVFWYCMDGTSYATCQNVSAGAFVSPSSGVGNKYCKVPPPAQKGKQPQPQ